MCVSSTSTRLGGGDDATPALLAAVLPALAVVDERLRLLAREEAPDRLRRVREAGVVGVDERARDDGGDRALDAARGEGGLEGVEQREADRPLRLRAAPVERHRRHDVRGELVLDEEVADLGPVAVGDDDLVPGGDELGEVLARGRRWRRAGPGAWRCRRARSWRCRPAPRAPSRRVLGRHGVSLGSAAERARCHLLPNAAPDIGRCMPSGSATFDCAAGPGRAAGGCGVRRIGPAGTGR